MYCLAMDDLVQSFTDAVEQFVAFPGDSQAERLGQESRNLIAFITKLQESRTQVQDLALQNAKDLKKTMTAKKAIEDDYDALFPELAAAQEKLKVAQSQNIVLKSRLTRFDEVQMENEKLQDIVKGLENKIQDQKYLYNRMTNAWREKEQKRAAAKAAKRP